MEQLYKVSEFAELIGVSIVTLRRWDREGRLVAHRTYGNQRFYTQADYIAYMNRGNQDGSC